MVEVRVSLAQDGGRDDRVDLDAGDVFASRSEAAGDVPSASRSDYERFRGRPKNIWDAGPSYSRLCRVRSSRLFQSNGGIPVDASASM